MSASRILSAPEMSRTALGLRSVGVSRAAFRRAFASVVVIASPVFWLLEKMVESVHPARFGIFNISADPFVPSNDTLALKLLEKASRSALTWFFGIMEMWLMLSPPRRVRQPWR